MEEEVNQSVEKKRNTSPPRGARAEKNLRRPFEVRLRAVKLHLEEGFTQRAVAQEMNISHACLDKWLRRYREHGEEGLKDRDGTGSAKKLPEPVRQKILELKKEEPARGIKRISQLLRRVFFLKASPETVRQTLRERGLVESPPKPKRNLVRPRFFERATPNQLWQTDIFTFRLGGRYAYVVAFMDDYSRYIVGADLFRSPTAQAVIEVYRVAVGEYQPPKEMLTDNGRQYTTWRGTSRFEAELKKDRVIHIKSRPQHPMTLGKVERFWATLWQEFLSRAQFESFEQARERIKLWTKYYNHKRPHQGIEGLCPADRYFEIAWQLRKTMEAGIQENILEMALRGQPKAPFYMVGRMEGQSVVLRAEKGKLKLELSDQNQKTQELTYDLNKQDNEHGQNQTGQESSGAGVQRRAESPSGAGGMDRALPSGGCLPPNENPGDHLQSLAKPGDGGNAPGAAVPGQPCPGPGFKSALASALGSSAPESGSQSDRTAPGADPACQNGGKSEKNGVDDSLRETSQPDTASALGPDHGPRSSPAIGDLPASVLQMGEAGLESPAQRSGGPAQGPAQRRDGPGEGQTAEPGGGTGTASQPLPGA